MSHYSFRLFVLSFAIVAGLTMQHVTPAQSGHFAQSAEPATPFVTPKVKAKTKS